MKVEVENTDCDEVCEAFPDSFWVATVLRISGYRALLRYEGFGHNADKDFWVSLCSNDIHPVGWCATIGKPLIPPNSKYHMIICIIYLCLATVIYIIRKCLKLDRNEMEHNLITYYNNILYIF